MKKLLSAAIIFHLFGPSAFSQTVNDVPLKNVDVEYIEIVGTTKLLSTKLNIRLDFGQENKFWSDKEYQLKDADGKKISFNSMIDALNFMSKSGYELVMPYVVTDSNNLNVYHYLLRKKKG